MVTSLSLILHPAIVFVLAHYVFALPRDMLLAAAAIMLALYGLIRRAHRAGIRQTRLLRSLLAGLSDTLHSIKPLKAMSRADEVYGGSDPRQLGVRLEDAHGAESAIVTVEF